MVSVASGGVGNHANHATMNKAMLLLNALPVRNVNFGQSMFDDRHGCFHQMHRALLVKAGQDTFSEVGVRNVRHVLCLLLLMVSDK
jgi:hypothetical protein